MLIVHPDFDRRIDLPGAGPCPRPVDIDRSRTGFADLVSLRVYSFAAGLTIEGEAEADEVFIVAMRGDADLSIAHGDAAARSFPLRPAGGARAVYMPPAAHYRLCAVTDCDIAYARCVPATGAPPGPAAFAPEGNRLIVAGHATGMALALATVAAGDPVDGPAADAGVERLIHLRTADEAAVTIAGQPLRDWDSVALAPGEAAAWETAAGAADIMTITASGYPNGARKVFN